MENTTKDQHADVSVTVAIGVYNSERFVEAAVRSVLAQSYRDFELIVIDDGSTDRSLAILQRLAVTDPRIKVLSHPNQGIARTGNVAIQMARGRYFVPMDHDDVMMPDAIEKLVAHMDSTPTCVAACGSKIVIDGHDNVVAIERCESAIVEFPMDRLPKTLPHFNHPASIMRVNDLVDIEGYRSLPGAVDYEMWLRLAERGTFQRLPFVSLRYRWHGANETSVRGWQNLTCAIAWHLMAISRRGSEPQPICIRDDNEIDLERTAEVCATSRGYLSAVDDALLCAARACSMPHATHWGVGASVRRRVFVRALQRPWSLRRVGNAINVIAFAAAVRLRLRLETRPRLLKSARMTLAVLRRLTPRNIGSAIASMRPGPVPIVMAILAVGAAVAIHLLAVAMGTWGYADAAIRMHARAAVFEVFPIWTVLGSSLFQLANYIVGQWREAAATLEIGETAAGLLATPTHVVDELSAYSGDSMAEWEASQQQMIRRRRSEGYVV